MPCAPCGPGSVRRAELCGFFRSRIGCLPLDRRHISEWYTYCIHIGLRCDSDLRPPGRKRKANAVIGKKWGCTNNLNRFNTTRPDRYMAFPARHRTKLHSTDPPERHVKDAQSHADADGIFANDVRFIRLIGAVVFQQNDGWQWQHRNMRLESRGSIDTARIEPLRSISTQATRSMLPNGHLRNCSGVTDATGKNSNTAAFDRVSRKEHLVPRLSVASPMQVLRDAVRVAGRGDPETDQMFTHRLQCRVAPVDGLSVCLLGREQHRCRRQAELQPGPCHQPGGVIVRDPQVRRGYPGSGVRTTGSWRCWL